MPASARITAPNPSIFTSDPLEQIYARDMFAPGNKGGLAYMFLNAAESARDRNQQQYTGAVDRSNESALFLGRLEEAFKHKQEMAKLGADLAKHGFLPSTMPGTSDIFGGNPAAGDSVAQLFQDLERAKIGAANRSGTGGGAGAARTTITDVVMPWEGGSGPQTIVTRGGDANVVAQTQARLVEEAKRRAAAGLPPTEQQKAAIRETVARQQYPGISE